MQEQLNNLQVALNRMLEKYDNTTFPNDFLSDKNANEFPFIFKKDISLLLVEAIKKVEILISCGISEDDITLVEEITQSIEKSDNHLNHFNNHAAVAQSAKSLSQLIISLLVILEKLQSLTSYEKIKSQEIIPSVLIRKLESYRGKISSIGIDFSSIEEKVHSINDAYSASILLPETTKTIKDKINEIEIINQNASNKLEEINSELSVSKEKSESIKTILGESKNLFDRIKSDFHEQSEKIISDYKKKIDSVSQEADGMITNCKSALRITTSYGLSGAFYEKAKKLNNSVRLWVLALSASLIMAALIGHERLNALQEILSSERSSNFAIVIQITLSFMSLFAPLWFSWIATKQISQRFKLAEDYEYKASISKAYEGYRSESIEMDGDFRERLFGNALTRLEEAPLRYVSTEDTSSPLMEFLNSKTMSSILRSIGDTPETILGKVRSEKNNPGVKPAQKEGDTTETKEPDNKQGE